MKKILTAIFAITIAAAAAAQKQQSRETVLSEMSKVAQQHNNSLDLVYQQLSANRGKLNSKTPEGDLQSALKEIVYETPPYNPYPNQPSPDILTSAQNAAMDLIVGNIHHNQTGTFTHISGANWKMSQEEFEFSERLQKIVSANESNLQKLQAEISIFNNDVFNKLGTQSTGAVALIAGSTIAVASANYWNANSAKWSSLGSQVGKVGEAECCKGILLGDVSGAISGAVIGGIAGSGAAGVGALPGAASGAVIGAVTGSAVAAVFSLLQWFSN